METDPSITTEAQSPTPGVGGTQEPSQEPAMDSSPSSSTPSNGTETASPKTPPTPPENTGQDAPKKNKKKRAKPFRPEKYLARAELALTNAKDNPNAQVQADVVSVQVRMQDLRDASSALTKAQGAVVDAKVVHAQAEDRLKPRLFTLEWALRSESGGRGFVSRMQAATQVETAENILRSLGEYAPPVQVVSSVRGAAKESRGALDEVTACEKQVKVRETAFHQAAKLLSGAVTLLNQSVKRSLLAPEVLLPETGRRSKKKGS